MLLHGRGAWLECQQPVAREWLIQPCDAHSSPLDRINASAHTDRNSIQTYTTRIQLAAFMNAQGYILTLQRATERLAHVERTRARCPIQCIAVPATDAMQLADDEIAKVYRKYLHSPGYLLSLRRTEIACFMSHRAIWRLIAESGFDAGLVLEDDIELIQPDFDAAFGFAMNNLRPGDYVKFQVNELKGAQRVILREGHHSLVQPVPAPLGATSQLITRDAALRLLEMSATFDRPVDTFVQMTWLTQVPVKVVVPKCVSEISKQMGGSTISRRKSLLEVVRNELHRPYYRTRVALRRPGPSGLMNRN
jgi:GR25 family glycosyltransferase involved in LPS biosynthesis